MLRNLKIMLEQFWFYLKLSFCYYNDYFHIKIHIVFFCTLQFTQNIHKIKNVYQVFHEEHMHVYPF